MSNKILESLSKVNDELTNIAKDQQGYGYKFRGIDQVLNSLNPLFKKHKIITRRENLQTDRQVRNVVDKYGKDKQYVEVFLKCDYIFVSLEDGSELRTEGVGEGQDTSGGDKATSMATSNSYKYVIFEMFNIATEEQKDSDQVTAQKAEKKEVKKEIKKKGQGFRKSKPVPSIEPVEEGDDDEI